MQFMHVLRSTGKKCEIPNENKNTGDRLLQTKTVLLKTELQKSCSLDAVTIHPDLQNLFLANERPIPSLKPYQHSFRCVQNLRVGTCRNITF